MMMKIAYLALLPHTSTETMSPESRRCLRRTFFLARHSRNSAAPFLTNAWSGSALIGAPLTRVAQKKTTAAPAPTKTEVFNKSAVTLDRVAAFCFTRKRSPLFELARVGHGQPRCAASTARRRSSWVTSWRVDGGVVYKLLDAANSNTIEGF